MSTHSQEQMAKLLESAARLQQIVSGAVLVGGSAASIYAGHRLSVDHDHVISDLNHRFDVVFEALKADPGWETAKAVEGKIILGSLDGIEAGIRQLRRAKPLETTVFTTLSNSEIVIPTPEETLRIKAYFIVNRNQVRDYIDVVALSDMMLPEQSAQVLLGLDEYYSDVHRYSRSIATELVEHLSDPNPKDFRTIANIENYKELKSDYRDWDSIVKRTREIALEMTKNASI